MKKTIIMFAIAFASIFLLTNKKINATPKIDINDYEEVKGLNLTWSKIDDGYEGPVIKSNIFELKRNQNYLVPVNDSYDNCYVFIKINLYDNNQTYKYQYVSNDVYVNKTDFSWVIAKYKNLDTTCLLFQMPDDAKYASIQFEMRTQDASDEYCLNAAKEFCKVHKLKTDDIPPVIQGEGVYITNVDHPVYVETIKNSLEAYDNVDGNISNNIIIKSDNYTGNEKKVGEYKVVFECADTAGNIAQYEVTIKVYDITNPSIESKEYEVISSMSDAEKTIEQIKALLSAKDNVDGDLTESIEIIEDNYTGNEDKVGRYKIVFKVTDTSGNYTTCDVYVNVKDNIPPMILVEGTIIPISVFESLSIDDIKEILKSYLETQNLEVEEIFEISNEYESNKEKAGKYKIKFGYRLKTGETSDFDLDILVYEPDNILSSPINNNKNNLILYISLGVMILGITSLVIILKKKNK